jgi:lysophospholipase L1-like esterase
LFFAFLGINGIIFVIGRKRKPLFWGLSVNLLLLALIGSLYGVCFFITSERYVDDPDAIDWQGFESNVESEEEMLERLSRYDAGSDCTRILFIGTSQTWGAGATSLHKTFVARAGKLLNESGDTRYEMINAGMSGVDSNRLLQLYASSWLKLQPDIVVLNLSNNDRQLDFFRHNLEHFVLLNVRRRTSTIFVLEPNAENNDWIAVKHKTMQEIGAKHGVPVVDMHFHLMGCVGDGYLWWDIVHLTDFGQALFAERMFQAIADLDSEADGTAKDTNTREGKADSPS